MKDVERLKKFFSNPTVEDFNYFKKQLKILNTLLENTTFTNKGDVSICGDFFIHEDCYDFNYFLKWYKERYNK